MGRVGFGLRLLRVAHLAPLIVVVAVLLEAGFSNDSPVVAKPVDQPASFFRGRADLEELGSSFDHKVANSILTKGQYGNSSKLHDSKSLDEKKEGDDSHEKKEGDDSDEKKDGEEGEEGEEDEEEGPEDVSKYVSIMLLGSISFIMALFYLVNHPDPDIERYAWKVISATISIFCAVLLFQAFNGMCEEYVIDGVAEAVGWKPKSEFEGEEEGPKSFAFKIWESCIDMTQLLFWLCMMNGVLAMTSGAVEACWVPKSVEDVEIPVKSFAVLFAHIAGFAAINGWGSLQQNWLRTTPLISTLIVPIALVGLFALYRQMDNIRNYVSMGDDGEVDEFEEKWDDETEESENDVAGLSTSFLTCQCIKYFISGDLPESEGDEAPGKVWQHDFEEWRVLMFAGIVFLVGLVLILRVRSRYPDKEAEEEEDEEEEEQGELSEEELKEKKEELEAECKKYEWQIRSCLVLIVYFSNGLAWCFFYGTVWAIAHSRVTDKNALLHVYIALLLSFVSFVMIRGLDQVEDSGMMGAQSDRAIEEIISALGILIGFSWEQSFDVAVDVISDSLEEDVHMPKTVSRLLMSVTLVAVVFPAWKGFILPQELKLLEETTKSGAKKKKFEDLMKKHTEMFMKIEGEDMPDERDMDHAHLAMKLHRRMLQGKDKIPVRSGLKHMLVTAKGLVEVPAPTGSKMSTMHERLLPDCLREQEEEEAQSGSRLMSLLAWRTKSASEEKEGEGDNRRAQTV